MDADKDERLKIAHAIRAYIAKEHISRDEFVHRTKLGKSTVDKLLTGLFSDKTLLQVETTLKQSFSRGAEQSVAPEAYGRYDRADVQRYLGTYVFVRPCFTGEPVLWSFGMEVVWDDSIPALIIRELPSPGTIQAQLGHVHIPRSSMHVFIHSNESGWLKQVILTQLDHSKKMRGVMLTMGDVFANVYMPLAMPVLVCKCDDVHSSMIGQLTPKSERYSEYLLNLAAVEMEKFARWVPVPPAVSSVPAEG